MREAEGIATYELVGKFIMYQIAIAISSGGGEADQPILIQYPLCCYRLLCIFTHLPCVSICLPCICTHLPVISFVSTHLPLVCTRLPF